MNDSSETTWAIPIIGEEIRRQRTEQTSDFFEAVSTCFRLNKADLYLASFSRDADSLSQWRAYAADGDGFAIGFHSATFNVTSRCPNWSPVPEQTTGFVEIQYDDELLKRAIVSYLEQYRPSQGGDRNTLILTLVNQLRVLAYSFKNPAFHEEHEWRIAYTPLVSTHFEKHDLQISGRLTDVRFRSTRCGVLPYFELPFGQEDCGNSIVEIVIGPKNRTNVDQIEMMLLSLGYKNATVRRSAATYR
jgi:hypothetical protein